MFENEQHLTSETSHKYSYEEVSNPQPGDLQSNALTTVPLEETNILPQCRKIKILRITVLYISSLTDFKHTSRNQKRIYFLLFLASSIFLVVNNFVIKLDI